MTSPMLRFFTRPFLLVSVIGILAGSYAIHGWAQNTAIKEFTAVETNTLIGEGRVNRAFSRLYASSADGKLATEMEMPGTKGGKIRHVTDPQTLAHYVIDPDLGLKSTLKARDKKEVDFFLRRDYGGNNCSVYAENGALFKGIDTILGVRVARYVWGGVDSKTGEDLHKASYAVDLNCFKMSAEHIWTDQSGNRTGKTIETIVSITLAPPDPDLFVTDKWKEVPLPELREKNLVAHEW